jgi:hypothetical protein
MKKILTVIIFSAALNFSVPAFSAVTLHYSNNDVNDLTVKIIINGLPKFVTFQKQYTGFVIIHGSGTTAEIVTAQGKMIVNSGDKVRIVNGMVQR